MAYLLTIPPQLIAIAAALILVAICSTRGWHWPMLFEVAAIVAYVAHPSPRLLIGTLFLIVLRWVPPFAAIVAEAAGIPSWGGLSLPVALFALPGLRAYVRGAVQPERGALPPVVAATGKTIRLTPPQAHVRTLDPAEWFAACNEDPTAPHLGIVGPTQYGKTTFALALVARRPGELVITTTKSDLWAGADVLRPRIELGAQRGVIDWEPITEAVRRVHFEMLRRNVAHDTQALPLTLVIDEFTTTLANIARETRDQIVEIWSMGASCGVRTIVIAQEVNARAWGLEGRRDVLNNLLFARVESGRQWSLGRLDPNGGLLDPIPLDTAGLVTLARAAQLAGRDWGGARGAPAAGAWAGGQTGSVPGAVPALSPAPVGVGNVPHGNGNAGTSVETLRRLRAAGITREQARNAGFAFRDEHWTQAGN